MTIVSFNLFFGIPGMIRNLPTPVVHEASAGLMARAAVVFLIVSGRRATYLDFNDGVSADVSLVSSELP